jgi:hypothetical protein
MLGNEIIRHLCSTRPFEVIEPMACELKPNTHCVYCIVLVAEDKGDEAEVAFCVGIDLFEEVFERHVQVTSSVVRATDIAEFVSEVDRLCDLAHEAVTIALSEAETDECE